MLSKIMFTTFTITFITLLARALGSDPPEKLEVIYKPTLAGKNVTLHCNGTDDTLSSDLNYYIWQIPGDDGGILSANKPGNFTLNGNKYLIDVNRSLTIIEITSKQIGTYKCTQLDNGVVKPHVQGNAYRIPYAITPKNYIQAMWIAFLITAAFIAVCALLAIVSYFSHQNKDELGKDTNEVTVFDTKNDVENVTNSHVSKFNFVADAVERAAPAVVHITFTDTVHTFLGTMEARNGGSGVIIGPDGLVVTNAHVVGAATPHIGRNRRKGVDLKTLRVKVHTSDGREFFGRVLAVDRASDLAAIRLENADGNVIGITTMKLAQGEGVSFAIPAQYVQQFLEQVEKHEKKETQC